MAAARKLRQRKGLLNGSGSDKGKQRPGSKNPGVVVVRHPSAMASPKPTKPTKASGVRPSSWQSGSQTVGRSWMLPSPQNATWPQSEVVRETEEGRIGRCLLHV